MTFISMLFMIFIICLISQCSSGRYWSIIRTLIHLLLSGSSLIFNLNLTGTIEFAGVDISDNIDRTGFVHLYRLFMICSSVHFILRFFVFLSLNAVRLLSPIVLTSICVLKRVVHLCSCCEEWRKGLKEVLNDAARVEEESSKTEISQDLLLHGQDPDRQELGPQSRDPEHVRQELEPQSHDLELKGQELEPQSQDLELKGQELEPQSQVVLWSKKGWI